MPWKIGWGYNGLCDNHKGKGQRQWLGGGSDKEPNVNMGIWEENASGLPSDNIEKCMDGGNRGKKGHLWTLGNTTGGWRDDGQRNQIKDGQRGREMTE